MNEALIIIPTYNERDNLPTLCDQVLAALPTADLLIVDDNSPDGTGQLADEMARKPIRGYMCSTAAAKLGLSTATSPVSVTRCRSTTSTSFEMDADFSHDPVYLPALLAAAKDGAGVVIGSRRVPGGGTENWGLNPPLFPPVAALRATILGLGVRDPTSGFKCALSRSARKRSTRCGPSNGYSQIEMTYRAVRKVIPSLKSPIVFIDRRAGQSKMSSKIFAEAMGMVWRLRFASGI